MGMSVGSSGGSSVMAEMQMAQMAQKPAASAVQSMPPPVVASVQNNQTQSILSLLRGQGSNIDVSA